MTLSSMTYHESYGSLPTRLLNLYRNNNASPADHDAVLAAFDCSWEDDDIPWSLVIDFVTEHCRYGQLRLPLYL